MYFFFVFSFRSGQYKMMIGNAGRRNTVVPVPKRRFLFDGHNQHQAHGQHYLFDMHGKIKLRGSPGA